MAVFEAPTLSASQINGSRAKFQERLKKKESDILSLTSKYYQHGIEYCSLKVNLFFLRCPS